MTKQLRIQYLSKRCDCLWDLYWAAPTGSRRERLLLADYLVTVRKLQQAQKRYAR